MPSHVSFSLNSGSAGFSPDFTRIEPVFVVVGSLPGETDPARPTVAGNRSAGYPISSQDVRSVKEKPVCKKITTFPGFDDKAEEAANFYASIFKHSRMGRIARYGKAGAAVFRKTQEVSQGYRGIGKSHESNASDKENRHPEVKASLGSGMTVFSLDDSLVVVRASFPSDPALHSDVKSLRVAMRFTTDALVEE